MDSLFNNEIIIRSQQRFKSNHHNVCTEEVNKIALSSNDDRRIQTFNKITTFPYRTNVFKICKNEMLLKNKFSIKDIDKDNNNHELRDKSQVLRSEAQVLRNESQKIRSEAQVLRNEHLIRKNESQTLRDKSQVLRDEAQALRKESLLIRNEFHKIRNEAQILRNSSLLAGNESQAIKNESIKPEKVALIHKNNKVVDQVNLTAKIRII